MQARHGHGGGLVSHEALKLSSFLFKPERPGDYLVLLLRLSLLTCLVASIGLVLYAAFSPSSTYSYRLRLPAPSRLPDLQSPAETPAPTNLSHIIFCIAGSSDTWHERSRYVSLWWSPNSTRGSVWLERPIPKDKTNGSLIPVRVSDPGWTRFGYSSSRAAVRIARIFWDSYRLKLGNVRWFVMGDDDTVFFPANLVSVLGKYDDREMWYIGGNSESVEQDVMHSYEMAFGGGGFAISQGLAQKLFYTIDGCLERYHYFYGSDQRIAACVSEMGVPFTMERGFHQLDVRGDPYGLLAAHPMAPLVSLHHLDSLDPIFPKQTQIGSLETLMSAYRFDASRVLQQSFCYDLKRKWSISIAWGYTIQIYTYFLSAKDLETPLQTFKTWRSRKDGPFTFNTRPMKSNRCERPVIFYLNKVDEAGSSGTRTRYTRANVKNGGCSKKEYIDAQAVHTITVSSLKLDADYWNKARRRQCCEVLDKGNPLEGDMYIRIRKCGSSEIIAI